MSIPDRMIAMRKYRASRKRRVNILAPRRRSIAMVRVEMRVVRSITILESAKVIPAKVIPANPSSATDPRSNEAVRNIRTDNKTNTMNPVINNIPILAHPSAMNPTILKKNVIPPKIMIDRVDMIA